MATIYYEVNKELETPLPSYVWVIPVVSDLDNIYVKMGSGSSPYPDLSVEGERLIQVQGKYLRIRFEFQAEDSIRKIVIFRVP